MNDLLLKGYECLTVILPFLITFILLNLIYKHKKIPGTEWKFLKLLIFMMYICAVFYFTGAGTVFDLQRYGIRLGTEQINLFPFSRYIDITAYFLNILLFIPFGFFLKFIWSGINKLKYIVLSGFSFSLLIETSQLFSNRQTDIDDLILNTLGTLLGYLLYRIFFRMTGGIVSAVSHLKYEPIIYILTVFSGHFLMFNEFGLTKILYGF